MLEVVVRVQTSTGTKCRFAVCS